MYLEYFVDIIDGNLKFYHFLSFLPDGNSDWAIHKYCDAILC